MKRLGFTLLEVLIATALASILSVSLLVMWRNMNQMRNRMDRYVTLYQRATLIYSQLDRDISGAFLPVEADMSQARIADMVSTASAPSQSAGTSSGQKPVQRPAMQGPAKLEKPFFGDHTLSELTFVTNNIMQRYWSAKLASLGAPQPRVARIIYKLVPDTKHVDSFILMRTESSQIYLDSVEKSGARAYQIAHGIKAVRMQYGVFVEMADDNKTVQNQKRSLQQPQKSGVHFERKVVTEWKKIEDQKPPWPLVPEWVTMELELWDDAYLQAHTYLFEFYIYPRFDVQKPNQRGAASVSGLQIKSPLAPQASGVKVSSIRVQPTRNHQHMRPVVVQEHIVKESTVTVVAERKKDA